MADKRKLTETTAVSSLSETDSVIVESGGKVGRIAMPYFRSNLNNNDNQVLNDLAFYIDVNKPSSKGSDRVDTGGNMNMRQMWEDAHRDVLMDAKGNYCELNPNDCRYTAEGEAVADLSTNAVLDKWSHCDFMRIIPKTYGRVQEVVVGDTTIQRLWLSLVPLPGGYVIPQQVVGKFKSSLVNNAMRSLPNQVPDNSKKINDFWNLAQARSKNHGLANMDFRNHLLFYMMSKYGWRASQECKIDGGDGTPVWGVGLDGAESNSRDGQNDKFWLQTDIRTGSTLTLGKHDGKVNVTDSNGDTVHSVNVCGFENPWGQYFEFVQGLCSVNDDVYFWRSNFMPNAGGDGRVPASAFDNVDHIKLHRSNADGWNTLATNIVSAGKDGQGCYMIPYDRANGIDYHDWYSYNSTGQVWLWGGNAGHGSGCGLACSYSPSGWASSWASLSARLAYYGSIKKVSAAELADSNK